MELTKRISLYAHVIAWIGLLIYTVYFRLTYHLIDVPADYLMAQNRFFSTVNIILTVLYALYIVGYAFMLSKGFIKWIHIVNIILGIVIFLRALFMAGLDIYVVVNITLALIILYQIVFSYHAIKSNQGVNHDH